MQDVILGFKHEFVQVNVCLFNLYLLCLTQYGIGLESMAFRVRPDSTQAGKLICSSAH